MMFPKRLKELRIKHHLAQSGLARELNVSLGAVGNWESGIRTPDTRTLEQIADYFGTSVDYLLGREEEKKTAQNKLPISPEQIKLITAVFEISHDEVKKTLEYVEFLKSKHNS